MEKCGKSALAGWEQSGPVNSIRSNTVGGHDGSARPVPRRWLESAGNGRPRQMAVQYRTRLIDLLASKKELDAGWIEHPFCAKLFFCEESLHFQRRSSIVKCKYRVFLKFLRQLEQMQGCAERGCPQF